MRSWPTPIRRRRGLSLVDAMLAMLVLSGIAAAGLRAAATSATAQLAAAERQTAARLAESLMAEVIARPWGATTPTGNTRSTYTDLWQYNGLDGSPTNRAGQALTTTPTGTWRQRVVLEYVQPSSRSTTSASDTGLTRITITVLKNDQVRATRVAYKAKDN